MKRIALAIEAVANNVRRKDRGKEGGCSTCGNTRLDGHSNNPRDEDVCVSKAGVIARQL